MAKESENMIDKYLAPCNMFALFDDDFAYGSNSIEKKYNLF
jgi:hypothetical protein